MKKTATKKMNYGGAKTMKSGGKATAKPKMAAGGATPKKKYAMGSTVMNTETCKDGDPSCKQPTYGKSIFGKKKAPKAGKNFEKKKYRI